MLSYVFTSFAMFSKKQKKQKGINGKICVIYIVTPLWLLIGISMSSKQNINQLNFDIRSLYWN